MNIAKPNNHKLTPKHYFIAASVITVVATLIIVLIDILDIDSIDILNIDILSNKTTINENAVKDRTLAQAQSSVFATLKTSDNFFTTFDKPKPKPKIKPQIKPGPKPTPKASLKFDDMFESIDISSKEPIDNVGNYLNRANRSSQTRTFRKYQDFEINHSILSPANNSPIDSIDNTIGTHYESANSKASYPIDFSRTLTADRNIYGILINEIDSELQGKVIAQIESNIYAAHDRFILIPAGSKAIGYYQVVGKVGETRLQVLWSRIITPKGVDIIINAELADQMGRSGLAGEVDSRFWDKYGATLLFSTINALGQYKVNTDKNQSILANTYGKDLANISASTLAENINIKPIIRINAGTRISISLLEDVWFREIDGKVRVQALSSTSKLF